MLLIDLDYLKSTQQELWSNAICQRFGEASAVLLNAPTSTSKELLLMWPHTSGLFFRQDTLDRLVFGIRKVLQGEYWIPRHLLCDLVDYYRQGSGQPQRQQTLLTAREQEIVRHLMTGPPTPDRRQPVRERTHRQIPSLQRLQEAERQETGCRR